MTYTQAKARADALWEAARLAGAVLQAFPRSSVGLVSDATRATPEYQAAKAASDKASAASRAFNAVYVKTFSREIAAARAAKRSQIQP